MKGKKSLEGGLESPPLWLTATCYKQLSYSSVICFLAILFGSLSHQDSIVSFAHLVTKEGRNEGIGMRIDTFA